MRNYEIVLLLAFASTVSAKVSAMRDLRDMKDIRPAVSDSLGMRYARPLGARRIELVFGMSVSKAVKNPVSYTVLSFSDDVYAYDKFIHPKSVKVRKLFELKGVDGSPFANYHRTVVELRLPFPMKSGNDYYCVARGINGLMVTGARTARGFSYNGVQGVPYENLTTDTKILCLRKISPVGAGILKLQFGPNFATEFCADESLYNVTVNGVSKKVRKVARRSMVDFYLPVGWPFKAIPYHDIFLKLPVQFKDGDIIRVSVSKKLTSSMNSIAMRFNLNSIISDSIKVNQVGYMTDSPVKMAYLGCWMGAYPEKRASGIFSTLKRALGVGAKIKNAQTAGRIPRCPALEYDVPPNFELRDAASGKTVYLGTARLVHRAGRMNEGFHKVDYSGENVYELDFSDFKIPGEYFISVKGTGRSLNFTISNAVYRRAMEIAARGVVAQRCGIELKPPFSLWRRAACHRGGVTPTSLRRSLKRDIRDLPKFIEKGKPLIKTFGGHHDAGDFNPRSHIDVAYTLMDAYEMNPRKFTDEQLPVPERNNGIPDILDEAAWALRLWPPLQDVDGGVRGGTESDGDPNFIQTAESDPKGDFAFAKEPEASFVFAAVFAQASRIWRSIGKKKAADDFLSDSLKAYQWAIAERPPRNSQRRKTPAEYGSAGAYAAAELLATTGKTVFDRDFKSFFAHFANTDIMASNDRIAKRAVWAYARYVNSAEKAAKTVENRRFSRIIVNWADKEIANAKTMGYKFLMHPRAPIVWGTGAQLHGAIPVSWAYDLTSDPKYLKWIIRSCDNTLGANPICRSYIVGLGTRTVRAPLHSSRYSHFGEAVAGTIPQGPNSRGAGYRIKETAFPTPRRGSASLHTFADAHFAIAMDEGTVILQTENMAIFALLIPNIKGGPK